MIGNVLITCLSDEVRYSTTSKITCHFKEKQSLQRPQNVVLINQGHITQGPLGV